MPSVAGTLSGALGLGESGTGDALMRRHVLARNVASTDDSESALQTRIEDPLEERVGRRGAEQFWDRWTGKDVKGVKLF